MCGKEQYIADWHYFLKDLQEMLKASCDEGAARRINMYLLNCFFVTPYREDEDFYPQFTTGWRERENRRFERDKRSAANGKGNAEWLQLRRPAFFKYRGKCLRGRSGILTGVEKRTIVNQGALRL